MAQLEPVRDRDTLEWAWDGDGGSAPDPTPFDRTAPGKGRTGRTLNPFPTRSRLSPNCTNGFFRKSYAVGRRTLPSAWRAPSIMWGYPR